MPFLLALEVIIKDKILVKTYFKTPFCGFDFYLSYRFNFFSLKCKATSHNLVAGKNLLPSIEGGELAQ